MTSYSKQKEMIDLEKEVKIPGKNSEFGCFFGGKGLKSTFFHVKLFWEI